MMRRLGILIGDSDPVVEYDLQRFLPRHISFHVGRLDMPRKPKLAARESLQMMCDSAPFVAQKVALAEVEYFLFACTSASFFRGRGWDRRVAKSIEDATDIPAITTATAVADALDALGARRIFMATPYSPQVNAKEIAFLGYRGGEVPDQFSFGCVLSREVALIPPNVIRTALLKRKAAIKKTDALFISCTMLRTMEIAEELEALIGVPVVTSNTASIWALLQCIGEEPSQVRAGSLFTKSLAR